MLIAQAFIKLIYLWENKSLKSLSSDLLRDQVLIVLFQALVRILQSQESNGSWSGCFEGTAYAIIALANFASLPFIAPIQPQIDTAIQTGREFLRTRPAYASPEYLWIEKVTYGSNALSRAYTLSALNVSVPATPLGEAVSGLTSVHPKAVMKFSEFFCRLPLYSGVAKWRLQAALIEGALFLPSIKRVRLDIFPRQGMEEDKYLDYIPFTWTGANNRDKTYLTSSFLHDMMVQSMLNYQADEYMEAVAGRYFENRLEDLVSAVNKIFVLETEKNGVQTPPARMNGKVVENGHTNGTTYQTTNGVNPNVEGSSELQGVVTVLTKFVHHVLHHPKVLSSSAFDRARLARELKTFLLAHVEQTRDNTRFAGQSLPADKSVPFETPTSSYYAWVQSTSANHTSCPFSFAFVSCLLSSGGKDFFTNAEEKYIGEDLCRQLAVTCRQYNDYGSVARDREEKNVNSINFPEFFSPAKSEVKDQDLKDELYRIAMFERRKLDMSIASLDDLCKKNGHSRVAEAVKMFVNVTDTYGQIYMVRDIASRM
jgi:hypothetical protein